MPDIKKTAASLRDKLIAAASHTAAQTDKQAVCVSKKPETLPQRVALLLWESSAFEAPDWTGLAVREWARALSRTCNDVHVFTSAHVTGPTIEKIDNLVFHLLPDVESFDPLRHAERGAAIIHPILAMEEDEHGPFDLIHGHGWMTIPALSRINSQRRHRSVVTLFSIEPLRQRGDAAKDRSKSIQKVEMDALKFCERILVLDPHLKNEIVKQYQARPEQVALICAGFDDSRFQQAKDPGAIKLQYGIGPLEPLILFVGEMSIESHVDVLLDALPEVLLKHPEVRAVMVGDGEQFWPLKVRSHYLGIEHALRLLGHREGQEVYRLFQAADMMVMPGWQPAADVSILFAFAAGKPVIAGPRSGEGIIRHQQNGLLVEANPQSMAQAILRYLDHWEFASQMAQAGRETIAQKFSWDLATQALFDIYSSLY